MRSRSQLTRASGLGAILIAAAITPLAGPAKAEDPGPLFCWQYASELVAAAKINQENGCYDASDARNPGSTTPDDHYNYCMSGNVSLEFLQFARKARAIQADNCSFCSSSQFATASSDRLLANKMYACHLTGAAYSDPPTQRFRACLNGPGRLSYGSPPPLPILPLSSRELDREDQNRLDQCMAQRDPNQIADFCQQFATKAYMLGLYFDSEFRNDACAADQNSAPSERWSRDWQFQFQWCIAPGNALFANEEETARETVIGRCLAGQGATQTPGDLQSVGINLFPGETFSAGNKLAINPQGPGGGLTPPRNATPFLPPFSQPNRTPVNPHGIGDGFPGIQRGPGGGFDTVKSGGPTDQSGPGSTVIGNPGGSGGASTNTGGGGFDKTFPGGSSANNPPPFVPPTFDQPNPRRIPSGSPGGPGSGGFDTVESGGPADQGGPGSTVIGNRGGAGGASTNISGGGFDKTFPGGSSTNNPPPFGQSAGASMNPNRIPQSGFPGLPKGPTGTAANASGGTTPGGAGSQSGISVNTNQAVKIQNIGPKIATFSHPTAGNTATTLRSYKSSSLRTGYLHGAHSKNHWSIASRRVRNAHRRTHH